METTPSLRKAALYSALFGALSCSGNSKPAMTPTTTTTPTDLEPGMFQSPLVRLKRLQGQVVQLHTDEIRFRPSDNRLFQCAYTFGVIDATDPTNMTYLAENIKHVIPNDTRLPGCIHLAWDGDIVYTTHRGNLSNPTFISGWDTSQRDPVTKAMKPAQLPVLQEPGESYEGIDVGPDGTVYVAIRDNGLAAYRRDPTTNILSRIGTLGGLGSTWGVRVDGSTVYVTDIAGTLSVVDVSDPTAPTFVGKVVTRGVPHGLVVQGSLVYVAAGSEGVAVVDVSTPTQPKVVGRATMPGSAIRVAYSDGYIFVAAWNDTRVFDVSNPSTPQLVAVERLTTEIPYPDDGHPPVTARTLGIAANGRNVFIGNWWVQYSYRLYPDRLAPHIALPETVNLMDFGPVAQGQTKSTTIDVENQGTAPLTLFDNWASGSAFSVTPKQLRLAPKQTGQMTVTYKATTGDKETSILNLWSDDPSQPVRTAFLAGNQPGLGIGKPLPETKATLLDGSEWVSSQLDNKVLLLAYFATF